MDASQISPKYLMSLIIDIENALWDLFPNNKYRNVKFYIHRWYRYDEQFDSENFRIHIKDNGDILLAETLHNIPGEILLRIAVDLGVQTPDFIPAIATFRNDIKLEHSSTSSAFEKAFKDIEDHPDLAIGLANTTLEGIIKEILKDDRIDIPYDKTKTLYDLTQDIMKAFQLYPSAEMPMEIRQIGSAFLKANQHIEKLRSEQTAMHGKTEGELTIKDPIYAYFIVNSVTTIGLFIKSYYRLKFPPAYVASTFDIGEDDDLPF